MLATCESEALSYPQTHEFLLYAEMAIQISPLNNAMTQITEITMDDMLIAPLKLTTIDTLMSLILISVSRREEMV